MNERTNSRVWAVAFLLVAATVLVAGVTPARAMYDPHHGRWLQRDPLGVRPETPGSAVMPARQYRDGMNLFGYVRSNPAGAVDSDGRDAYFVNDREWCVKGHSWVCVDVCNENGEVVDVVCYDIVFSTSLATDQPWWHRPKDIVEFCGCCIFGFPGHINAMSTGGSITNMGGDKSTHKLNCAQNAAVKSLLDSMVGPTYYNMLGRNCYTWALQNFDYIKDNWPTLPPHKSCYERCMNTLCADRPDSSLCQAECSFLCKPHSHTDQLGG